MRNLKLDIIKIQPILLKSSEMVRCVQVEDKYFILRNGFVHFLKDNNDVIIGENINTIDWIAMENILYMGNGKTFKCFNIINEQTSEIVIEEGFLTHEWNLSEDRIALINNEGILKILLLDAFNSQCTFIGSYKLSDIEKSPFINIGWGSQTTQFRGSEGKFTGAENSKTGEDSHDNSLSIAWRDEGDLFLVSFIRQGQRIFKVFSCECEFMYESEFKPGMSSVITWKPDGSLIATENRSPSGCQIMFFEKNGLHRYDLQLHTNKDIRKLKWNPTGDILMVWQESKEESEISLWTCTNFKWYLKQNLLFDRDNLVNYAAWSGARWLEIITAKNIIKYSWKWITLSSQSFSDNANGLGVIAVIDGNVLRISVTSVQIIPPPLSTYNINLEKPINFVAFGNSNRIAVILNDYTFKIFSITKSDFAEKFTGILSYNSIPLALSNFVFDDEQSRLYYTESFVNSQSLIYKIELDFANNQISQHKYDHPIENISDLLRIHDPNTNKFYLGACAEGHAILFSPDEQSVPEFDLHLFKNEIDEGGSFSVFFLLETFHTLSLNNQNFYFDGEKIANNITSYLFCQDYLLLTTENKLLCAKLNKKGLTNLQTKKLSNVYTRSIPSGALLVSAVPRTRKIILQIPRGELEIINPRVLAIDEIDRLLANKKHLEAFLIMRTDRINPNLLYDLNPLRFINDIEDLIKNVNNCEFLDVFLTQLQDHNVSEELYGNCFEEPLPLQTGDKSVGVFDKFIEMMKKIDPDFYLQSIVTAYVCKNTDEDLIKALDELSLAKHREKNGTKMRISVDSTLEHMIILSSVEKLYDIALAMDNLELIMWVASKSQLDPLEYIPFLRELVNMEYNYRNYKINCHIKHFEKALTFLLKCDNVFDELSELVTKNSLYKSILKYVGPTNQWYKPLLQLYGNYLNKEKHYKEAGQIFMRIGENEAALENFVKDCCMKEALTVFYLLGSDVVKMNSYLVELATRLTDKKLFQDASYIYNTVLNNYEESISILLKGCFWSDASYLAHKNKRHDIIESEIKPAVSNHTDYLCNQFKAYKEEFTNLTTRLQTIRRENIQKFRECGGFMHDGEYCENIDEYNNRNIDLESVVSTTYSQTKSQRSKSSHITSASSRRKKRIEKKVLQIREGSALENVAIIRRLHIIISEIQNLAQVVSDTCLQLIVYSEFYEKAVQLHLLYEELTKLTDSSKDAIWPPEIILPPNSSTVESQVYRMNLEHIENQYRWPPLEMKKNWKIFSL